MKFPEARLGPLTRRDDEPTFDEPWQAQILGMADVLVENGVIAADDWAIALGSALEKRSEAGERDSAELYYRAVLDAVETLLVGSGNVNPDDISQREQQWRAAYQSTPHGEPVELSLGADEPS
ncbi:MAG: nitrile hydratase accessory protein [Hyphomicrobiaceae bacterium]